MVVKHFVYFLCRIILSHRLQFLELLLVSAVRNITVFLFKPPADGINVEWSKSFRNMWVWTTNREEL